MRKRSNVESVPIAETPIKKSSIVPASPTAEVKPDTILTDITGKKWRLGKTIGTGGFGEIYLVSDAINREVKPNTQYVAKVETHMSGPLFVEIHCYLNIAKLQAIKEWKTKMAVKHLGMPHFIAFGSHIISGVKYRFLIMPRFESDLEKMFVAKQHKFNMKTVLIISLQLMDVLKYIHNKGYLHQDIKASNIGFNINKKKNIFAVTASTPKVAVRCVGNMPMRTCTAKAKALSRNLRPNSNLKTFFMALNPNDMESMVYNDNSDKVYLLDYGLACKYRASDGTHKPFANDDRRAHAGTILFCSRDAHLGAQSRRSDLECLGYNLIYWLTSSLPWSDNLDNPISVYKKKLKCMDNPLEFIDFSFNFEAPKFIHDYFKYILGLQFDDEPDYNYCKTIFRRALQEYGYKDDMKIDFDKPNWNLKKQKKVKCGYEKYRIMSAMQKFKRTPLTSNRPILLRKTIINEKLKRQLNWSQILKDPEIIIKNAKTREKKLSDVTESQAMSSGILNLNIDDLNPTETMLYYFNRGVDRCNTLGGTSPNHHHDDDYYDEYIEGYTPAMMDVHHKIIQRKEIEEEKLKHYRKSKKNKSKQSNPPKRTMNRKAKTINNCKNQKEKLIKVIDGKRRPYCLRG